MRVLATLYPDWRALRIHESSPGSGGASLKLKSECADYVATQYVPDCEPGSEWNGCRIEDLARQTFPDASFDIVVTQQVFEHLFEPGEAIAEIARTLRPGGAHLMTVPIVHRHRGSERRAALADGEVIYLREPQYHDNPVGSGSLVTVDWGLDIADYLAEKSGCLTSIYMIDDRSQGIIGKQIEVVVTRKPAVRRSI
jgi:SAM-dependent methyltransferase